MSDHRTWVWQQSGDVLHAIPKGRYRPCPGDTVRCLCGVTVTLVVEDFPWVPGHLSTCQGCHQAVLDSARDERATAPRLSSSAGRGGNQGVRDQGRAARDSAIS